MAAILEGYICQDCEHCEHELNGVCPKCGGEMECVDFIPTHAATPELLEALKAMMMVTRTGCMCTACRKTRAAIKKGKS